MAESAVPEGQRGIPVARASLGGARREGEWSKNGDGFRTSVVMKTEEFQGAQPPSPRGLMNIEDGWQTPSRDLPAHGEIRLGGTTSSQTSFRPAE